MFKVVMMKKVVNQNSYSDKFNCALCHSNSNPSDYLLIGSVRSSSGYYSHIYLLKKCNECSKFNNAKGVQDVCSFYQELLNDSLL